MTSLPLVLLLLCAAPALKDGLYSGTIPTRPGLVQLELKANKAHLVNVVTVHLPPAEIEASDFAVKVTEKTVCLSPAPVTVEPCLERKGQTLLARLASDKTVVTLEWVNLDAH